MKTLRLDWMHTNSRYCYATDTLCQLAISWGNKKGFPVGWVIILGDQSLWQWTGSDDLVTVKRRAEQAYIELLRRELHRVTLDPVEGVTADGDGHADRQGHEQEMKGL